MTAGGSFYLYPRLPGSAAHALFVERIDLEVVDHRGLAGLSHSSASPNPTGGHPVDKIKLESLQTEIRSIADEFGFPERMSTARQAEFDRVCGTHLFASMSIVPADAGHPEVWSFLTMVLLPEIAPWRFRDRTEERYLGGTRNTFQRLWWRAWSLGPDLTQTPEGIAPFGEDEYVQIMERPTISGNSRLAHALQAAVLALDSGLTSQPRPLVLRRAVIRVRAARSHLYTDLLTDEQLESLVGAHVAEAAAESD